MDDDNRRNGPPLDGEKTVDATNTGHDERGRFVAGNPGGRGRPGRNREFRELAREMSQMALKKLYSIALQPGTSMPQVRACEIIIERAWGRTAPAETGPKGGPVDPRFYSAARLAIENAIAEAEANTKPKSEGEN